MNPWQLPRQAQFGDEIYPIDADFRNMLHIIAVLQRDDDPLFLRWYVACGLFYCRPVPDEYLPQAARFLADFLKAGAPEPQNGESLLDWQADADLIVADINKAAGQEIRSLPFVHWWTFLGWFHAIGQGQLATVVSIRQKLRRGKKLEDWEREFYRENKARIDRRPALDADALAQKARLQALLGD